MSIQEKLMPVHAAMFCETSPGPVKYAELLLSVDGRDAATDYRHCGHQ